MYKIISIVPVIFLTSCFSSNNIIVDEASSGVNNKHVANNEKEMVISERNVITRGDKDFVVEELSSNTDDTNYSLSGLSKLSSEAAKEAVAKIMASHPDMKFVVYFEFNSSKLSPKSQEIIQLNNEFLASNPSLKLVLNGHTDIKGSREYNLSLGEERAIAVKKLMQGNIEVVSFGEEKTISNIDAKNRRVEFVYQ